MAPNNDSESAGHRAENARGKLEPCELCGSSSFQKVAEEAGHSIYSCRYCRLVQVRPLPKETTAVNKSYWNVDLENPTTGKSRWGSRQVFEYGLKRIEELIGEPIEGKKVLDVGCGMGMFLKLVTERGGVAHGIDLTEEAVHMTKERCNTDNVARGYFETFEFPEASFDVITGWGVLHHIRHPKQWVARANALLVEEGVLLIKGPNVAFTSMANKMYPVLKPFGLPRSNYLASRPPLNLYGFTCRTLAKLLVEEGFEVLAAEKAPINERQGARRNMVSALSSAARHVTLGKIMIHPVIMAIGRKRTGGI